MPHEHGATILSQDFDPATMPVEIVAYSNGHGEVT
jgi:hypothetical protein